MQVSVCFSMLFYFVMYCNFQNGLLVLKFQLTSMNLFVLCYHTIYTTYIYIYMNVFENKEIVENQNKHES